MAFDQKYFWLLLEFILGLSQCGILICATYVVDNTTYSVHYNAQSVLEYLRKYRDSLSKCFLKNI